jgi:two-component system NtrC family sensor kinase
MSIRNRLFLILSLMTLVPLLILLFGVVEREEQEIQQRSEREINKTLKKMTAEIRSLLDTQESLALGLSRAPVVQEFAHRALSVPAADYPRLSKRLTDFFHEYQNAVSSIQGLRFIAPGGKTLVKAKEGKMIEAKYYDPQMRRHYVADQSRKDFYQFAVNSNADVDVSNFELGQVSADADFCPAMLRYSVPVRDGGRFLGLLVVNMWGTRVDNVVEATLGGQPRKAYMVEISENRDRDGIYLYHQDNNHRFANQLGSNYRMPGDIGEKNWSAIKVASSHGALSLDDGRMIYYQKMRPYENRLTEWLFVIETTRDEMLAPTVEIRRSILYLLGLLLLLSFIAVRWVSSRIARPVQKLADNLTQYADGNKAIRYSERRRDEIGHAGRAFNYLVTNLEQVQQERDKAAKAAMQSERLAALGQLAAGIGHEINNPLQNILSLSALIDSYLKDTQDDEIREDVRLLQQEGKRCARIVQGILNFAREKDLRYQRFNLGQLLEDTLVLMKHQLETSGIRLELEIDEGLEIDGDPNQLQQVLVNLILNAIQASGSDNNLTVKTYPEGETVHIEIIDQGPGIPEEQLPKVFNPFYTTKTEGNGTGLGLSVSYGIVKKHNGQISLENVNGGGIKASVVLPRQLEEIQRSEVKESEREELEVRHVG